MIVAGIDYSMTCPCICINTKNNFSVKSLKFFYKTKVKKYHGTFKQCHGDPIEEYNSNEERFNSITKWVVDLIQEYSVEHVFLENYSFSSKGQVFNIGENTGLLKHYLWKNKIKFDVVSPSTVKKFSYKGNASKEEMHKIFIDETNINLLSYGYDISKNPSSDIVDSYFLVKYGYSLINE